MNQSEIYSLLHVVGKQKINTSSGRNAPDDLVKNVQYLALVTLFSLNSGQYRKYEGRS